MQQALSVQGPKVQLELQLGAVNIFLTPRQLHALIQLSNTFLVDSTKQRSAHHLDHENDNDQTSEYKAFNAMSGNLGLNQCWSSDPLGKCEKEEEKNKLQNQLNKTIFYLPFQATIKIKIKASHRWTRTLFERQIQCRIQLLALPADIHRQPFVIDEEVSLKSIQMLRFCVPIFV